MKIRISSSEWFISKLKVLEWTRASRIREKEKGSTLLFGEHEAED
jgi:hypothetical protein